MAGNSVIGALRVDLGLNSAQFTTGLAKAEGGLEKFGRAASIGLAAVATAAIAAGAALGVAVKGAIDHADALSKSAQKAGVTVESLSRLEYAAKLSDVSLEGLTGGLQKLSKSMIDTAQNAKSGPAKAFAALGIAVKDSSGNMRSSDAVLGDIADRFAKLPDGATKTALAIRLFGKAGAELIPLLNGGADGLKAMADESDRVGATISGKTAGAAEKFNDTLTRISSIMDGVVNKVMEAALPALQSLADVLASPDFATNAAGIASAVVRAMTTVAKVVATAVAHFNVFALQMSMLATGNFVGAYQLGQSLDKGLDTKPPNSSGSPDDRGNKPVSITVRGGAPSVGSFNSDTTGSDAAAKAYAQVIKSAQDRIDQSKLEAQVLGMTAEEADKLRFSQELLSQATADGTKLTGPQTAQLQGLAAGMAAAAEQARVMTDIYSTGQSVFGSFFSSLKSDLQAGQSLWASFGDSASKALNSIADKLISMAANGLFDMLFNAVAGGIGGSAATASFIPGGFVPGLTGPKLFAAGGVTRVPAIFGDNGPEAAVPLPDGRSIPVTLNGGAGGDTFYIEVNATSQSQGADIARVLRQQLPGELARLNRTPARRG